MKKRKLNITITLYAALLALQLSGCQPAAAASQGNGVTEAITEGHYEERQEETQKESGEETQEGIQGQAQEQFQEEIPSPQPPFMILQTDETVREFVSDDLWSCSTYVLSSDRGVIVVDPGSYNEELAVYLEDLGGVDAILLTHGHWDHIYGLDAVKADYPAAEVWINELDGEFLQNPELNCSDTLMNLVCETKADHLITEGSYQVKGYSLEVIHSPGHTAGSSLYYFPDEKIVFAGDSIMSIESPTYRPTGSEEDMERTYEKFVNYGFEEDTLVYSGHFGNTTYSRIVNINPKLERLIQ